MTVWACAFVFMFSTNAVGDSHPGHLVPFWQNACQQNLRNGCKILAEISGTYCQDGSGWACNELGVLRSEGHVENAQAAARDFRNGCALGFQLACQNVAALGRAAPRRGPPLLQDYPVILRSGKGPLPDRTPLELYARACDQGWMVGCESVGAANLRGIVTPRNPPQAAAEFLKACDGGLASACSNLGVMYHNGDGIPRDQGKALAYMKKACDLGSPSACELLKQENQPATR
jgi:TPR repeat protein